MGSPSTGNNSNSSFSNFTNKLRFGKKKNKVDYRKTTEELPHQEYKKLCADISKRLVENKRQENSKTAVLYQTLDTTQIRQLIKEKKSTSQNYSFQQTIENKVACMFKTHNQNNKKKNVPTIVANSQ